MLAGSGAALFVMRSSAARAVAAASDDLVVPAGTLRIEHDMVVEGSLRAAPGSHVAIAAGRTLTVRGDVVALAEPLFVGPGRVDLTRSAVAAARPEWWGAAADDPAVDCRAAFSACLAAHPAMLLGPGDYCLAGTWAIETPNRRIWGIGRWKDARGTRLVLTGGDGVAVRVGSETPPPIINDYLTGIDMRWIEIARTEPPRTGAIGLMVRHVLDGRFEGIRSVEHEIGFSVRGAVSSRIVDCRAFRSSWSDNRRFVGFDCDGHAPPIPTGGNASLTVTDCNATVGNPPAGLDGIGARITGAISDTWLVRFETGQVPIGVRIDGAGEGRGPAFDQIDWRLDDPVLDGATIGIEIVNLGSRAMSELNSPYVGLAEGGRVGIRIADTGGALRIAGGQLVGHYAKGATGIAIERADGVMAEGTAIEGFARPVTIDGATGGTISPAIFATEAPAGPAIAIARSRRLRLRPRIAAGKAPFSAGVAIDDTSRAIAVETIAIDPLALVRREAAVTVGGKPVPPREGAADVVVPA